MDEYTFWMDAEPGDVPMPSVKHRVTTYQWCKLGNDGEGWWRNSLYCPRGRRTADLPSGMCDNEDA